MLKADVGNYDQWWLLMMSLTAVLGFFFTDLIMLLSSAVVLFLDPFRVWNSGKKCFMYLPRTPKRHIKEMSTVVCVWMASLNLRTHGAQFKCDSCRPWWLIKKQTSVVIYFIMVLYWLSRYYYVYYYILTKMLALNS